EGLIPAELYGNEIENQHLSVDAKSFNKAFDQAGENTLVDLTVDGKVLPVLIHAVQTHYLSGDVIAIDFYAPNLSEEVTVSVPIVFKGESPAVKGGDGIFVPSLEELEVECLPTAIPHEFEVDISSLAKVGDSILVKDIAVPAGVKVAVEGETSVASIAAKMTEEEDAAMSAEADVAAVSVEGEKKEDEAVEGSESAEASE
ncbi:MAG: 50S ribosomal protein L25, partial [Candidatus Paceibacterota bacterium]